MDPDLIEALMRKARRERSEAVYRLIILPIKRLLTSGANRPEVERAAKAARWSRNARSTA
jgi:copper homeostasis protein CutC